MSRAHEQEVRARLPHRHAFESGQERLQALAPQQPARPRNHEGISRQAEAAAQRGPLVGARGPEARGVDPVREVGDPLGGDSRGQELLADPLRHRHERVGVAQQEVPERRAPSYCRGHRPPCVARSPGVYLAAHLAVQLGLEHDSLAEGPSRHQSGQAEDARPPHDQHVEGVTLPNQRGERRRDHPVLPGPARSGRRHPSDPDALERLLGRPGRVAAPRDHGRGHPRCRQARPERPDVLFAATQDGVERLGQEEDPRQRGGSAGSVSPSREGQRSWTT